MHISLKSAILKAQLKRLCKKCLKSSPSYQLKILQLQSKENTVATFRVKFGKKVKNYRQVLAYATFEESYVNLIEEGTAEKTLEIFCSNNCLIRRLEFPAPVMQVMSCRHHQGQAEEDMVYILLWNGNVLKVSGSMLEDPEITDDLLGVI